jgi:hypothetical protein
VIAALATPIVLVVFLLATVFQDRSPDDGTTLTGDSPGTTRADDRATEGAPTTTTAVPDTSTSSGPVDLLADASPALGGFATIYETTPRVRRMVLYPDYAIVEVQVPAEPTYVDEYTWDHGEVTGPEPLQLLDMETEELESKLFDLSEVDPGVIAAASQQMLANCPGDGIELTHVIIERGFVSDDQRVLMLVYASNPVRGGGGYISFTLDGTMVRNMCS